MFSPGYELLETEVFRIPRERFCFSCQTFGCFLFSVADNLLLRKMLSSRIYFGQIYPTSRFLARVNCTHINLE